MAEPYLERLSRLIASLSLPIQKDISLECKHFFSGAALYANGKICASLTPAGLGLKLPAGLRTRLLEKGEGEELRYFENAPIKKDYVLFSSKILDEPVKISAYLAKSIQFVTENTETS